MKKEIKNFESYVADIDIAGSGYNITFYDFPGCVSAGDSIKETIRNAKIALQMHIDGMLEDEEILPKPTDIETIIKTEGTESVRVIIDVNIKKIKRKRIDITLNANTIEMIDSVTGNRSKFLEEASTYYFNKYFK